MNSHLKGQIFAKQGASYLVLHEDGESPDWVWVRQMCAERTVKLMRVDHVMECLARPRNEPSTAAG